MTSPPIFQIMPQLNIKIQSLNETGKLVPGMTPENSIEATDVTCALLEGGTEGGQTAVIFIGECPVKQFMYFQLTAELFNMLIGAFYGAQTRFGQPVSDHITAKMGGQDQQKKLLDAGFKIYRFSWYEGQGGKITYCHTPGAWRLYEGGIATKAALERRKKEILKDPKALEG